MMEIRLRQPSSPFCCFTCPGFPRNGSAGFQSDNIERDHRSQGLTGAEFSAVSGGASVGAGDRRPLPL